MTSTRLATEKVLVQEDLQRSYTQRIHALEERVVYLAKLTPTLHDIASILSQLEFALCALQRLKEACVVARAQAEKLEELQDA